MTRKGRQDRGRPSVRQDRGPSPERRQRIAHEAARLMAQGLDDLHLARRRAASDMGEDARDALPSADQVLDALRQRQRLYRAQEQPRALRKLREAAIEAMGFLAAFDPRLVGSVLDGTADEGSPVRLQVFCDPPDALPRFLQDHGIPARSTQAQLRLPGGQLGRIQAWLVSAAGTEVELAVLPPSMLRRALPGHDPGTTQARAGLAAVRELLDRMDDAPLTGLHLD